MRSRARSVRPVRSRPSSSAKSSSESVKSSPQVLPRWCIERDVPVIPKSAHRGRIAENAQIFAYHQVQSGTQRPGRRARAQPGAARSRARRPLHSSTGRGRPDLGVAGNGARSGPNTSSRGTPLSRSPCPTLASSPYAWAVSICRYPSPSAHRTASTHARPLGTCQTPRPSIGIELPSLSSRPPAESNVTSIMRKSGFPASHEPAIRNNESRTPRST